MRQTISSPAFSELVIKKSRFIGCVQPIASRATAQQIINQLWNEHPEACHICWALLTPRETAAVDDGEPSGTAGRPMLEVLRHQQLENVLATVVRYFGGIKLGAGGLVRAYTDATAQALLKAEKIMLVPTLPIGFTVQYPYEGTVRHLLQKYDATDIQVKHTQDVCIALTIPADQEPALRQDLVNITQGSVQWLQCHDMA